MPNQPAFHPDLTPIIRFLSVEQAIPAPSRLGKIIFAEHARQMRSALGVLSFPGRPLKGETLRRTVAPLAHSEVTDYLPVPVLTVEHKIFGPGFPLHRVLLDNGCSAVVVFYDRATTRTLLIDAAYWVTPIEVLMGVELQRVDEAKFEYIPPSVEADADNYCSPLGQFVVVEKREWSEKEERARLHVEPIAPKVVPYDHVAMGALREKRYPTRCWVSAAGRAHREAKLFAEVTEFVVKNAARVEAAPGLERSAREYWKFCVAFEFPKVYDRKASEEAKQQLAREVPSDHLTALEKTFESRCLLNPDRQHLSFCDGVDSQPPSRRRYALGKRGNSNLAMEL
jgi:hypothetical protein